MLTGKTAIVTGASRGIGEAIAGKLAALGANIAAIYAGNTSAAEKVCETYQNLYGIEAKAYQCDVADFQAVKETVAKIKADFGTAHILINNAGITRDGLAAAMKQEDLDAVIDTTMRLPEIPGGKKIIYPGIRMPLTAIADFAELGKNDPLFAALARSCRNHGDLWNSEAENILLQYFNVI